MSEYPFTPLVAALPATVPFVGPEAQERARGKAFKVRIGANESVFGPSPKAIAAMAGAARDVWMYGDPNNHDLRQALAHFHGVGADNIVVTEGIDGGLDAGQHMFTGEGTPVVTSAGAYPTFNYQVANSGGRIVAVPYKDDREDLDGLIARAVSEDAPLIFLSNPDNPMGTWWTAEELDGRIDDLPDGKILFLDEAYSEFAPAEAIPAIDVNNRKVLRFRTFSKAYGMAGARIGYVIGEESLIRAFEKVRTHFGVNRIAQAGALAALEDQDYLAGVVAKVAAGREQLYQIARENGLAALASASNFVAIDCGRDGAFAARVMNNLLDAGIFVRMPGVAPLNRCIRVGVGDASGMAAFAAELPGALARARG